jgi:hypothetical protein
MRPIPEIASDYTLTDKGYAHRYWELYDLLFARRRDAETVLELGVYHGASLDVWREVFPTAEIHGVDIKPVATGAVLHVGDAYTEEMVDELPDCDVIIDDGPHTLESQLFVASHYTRKLKSGGILIIEDIQRKAWIPQLVASLPERLREKSFVLDRTTVPYVTQDSVLLVVDAWI